MARSIALTLVSLACWAGPLQSEPDTRPWHDRPQPRFAKANLGRTFSGTIQLENSGRPPTFKGLAIRVGPLEHPKRSGTILYDTELLRASAAIPEHSVMFNTFRDGLGGSGHWMGPPYLFTTRREPGWSLDGSFADPRPTPHGPLPRDQARYLGLYRHGPRSVLSFRVGRSEILESPWMESGKKVQAATRTFEIDPAGETLVVKLFDHAKAVPSITAPLENGRKYLTVERDGQVTATGVVGEKVDLAVSDGGRVVARFAGKTAPIRFKVLTWSGPKADLPAFLDLLQASPPAKPLAPWTEPGPAQWTENIVTKGRLGIGRGPYVVDTLTPPYQNPYRALMTFGGHDFFSNGDAAICTIHGDVWRVTGIDGSLEQLTWHRYATGLFQPLGLRIVHDKVYVLGRDQITRLHDANGDHQADYYENFNNDCQIGSHVHEFTTSLETDPLGNFYYIKGNNGGQTRHDGSFIRVSPDGEEFEVFATGFRWPNGGGAGPDGTLTVADQQGNWVPASRLDIVEAGGFYGYMPAHHRKVKPETYDGPLCWIPHSIDNSCGGQAWVPGDQWGPLEGAMVHLSYGKCRLFLVLQECVRGIRQGGLVRFEDVQFDSGAMRARFHPIDGQLYVSGLKGWQTSALRDGCFQRVRYTGQPLGMPVALNVHSNGLLITFSEPLDASLLGDPESWALEQWNYRWTRAYGSKEYKVSDPEQPGHDQVEIARALSLQDGRAVFLEVPGLAPVMQMQVRYNLGTFHGRRMRGAIHHTIHALRPAWTP